MHYWGEEFDWENLDRAIDLIVKRLKRFRIGVRQSKEKFGTCRIYCGLGWCYLHDITHPGHVFCRYPKWLRTLDFCVFSKIIKVLNYIILPIHKKVYRDAYKAAVDKYPHLKTEICCCADFIELLDFYNKETKTL